MKLSDLYCALSQGVLVNLHMADQANNTIVPDQRGKVVLALNEAMGRLSTRFVLKQKDFLLALQKDITFYHLRTQFSEQGYDPLSGNRPYILDLNREKFQEDSVKLLSVFNKQGRELALNDETQWGSLFTPQDKVLQVPYPEEGQVLSVTYQALHPDVKCNDEGDVIEIPKVLLPALYSYIGYHIYNGLNTEGSVGISQMYKSKYEEICGELENRDALMQSVTLANGRFDLGGWV